MLRQDIGGVVFDTQVDYLVHDFGLLQGRRVIRISFHTIGRGRQFAWRQHLHHILYTLYSSLEQ